MRPQPRVLLLTADSRRHRFVAQRLAGALNLVGIVSQNKRGAVDERTVQEEADREVIDKHLRERAEVERRLLGECDFPAVDRFELLQDDINGPRAVNWIEQKAPHFIVLYGTGILRPPLLSMYEGRMVNMHLGLSPYYRGAGTNFWPLVDGVPACVGCTIHLAVQKVDAGAVLAQVRPVPEADDRAHELGIKAIVAGVGALAVSLGRYAQGSLQPAGQDLSIGKVYRRSDFHADAVRRMWSNLDSGMLSRYLANRAADDARWPIRDEGFA